MIKLVDITVLISSNFMNLFHPSKDSESTGFNNDIVKIITVKKNTCSLSSIKVCVLCTCDVPVWKNKTTLTKSETH